MKDAVVRHYDAKYADDVRNEKVKVLAAVDVPSAASVDDVAVRAQYGPGVIEAGAVQALGPGREETD